MRFRPGRLPTVFVLVAIPILVGLGMWQVERMHWKDGLIARIEARLAETPTVVSASTELPREEFVRVRLAGRFAAATGFWLGGRTHRGQAGWHVVAPFELAGGGWVIVDQGWVPMTARAQGLPEAPGGAVEGIVRLPPEGNFFTPSNDAAGNNWFRIDPPAMAAAAGIPAAETIADVYVAAASPGGEAAQDGSLPIASGDRFTLPQNHLQYAVTWFGLALTLLGVYVAYGLRRDPPPVPGNEGESE